MYYIEEECNKLINRIQKACNEKGWSNYVLSKKADVSTSTVHGIMNGKTRPQIYTLLQICNALDMSVEELFGGTASKKEENTESEWSAELSCDEKALVKSYREFTEEEKEQLKGWVEMLEKNEAEE